MLTVPPRVDGKNTDTGNSTCRYIFIAACLIQIRTPFFITVMKIKIALIVQGIIASVLTTT